ncbi:sugar porter family MFS transporter [Paramicrobacterium chengjingii]|uniref:sugar porter family MFS transporter n=1 Tax=Paramicrobacterium chengjingii TaxID=2769067 RepID=UPI00141E0B13|nr:sugar porter family MFS transporter [Microbacterium chengjingii]
MTSIKKSRRSAGVVYFFGALGALLWGYDNGVIAGAMLFIKKDFDLDPGLVGLVTASITLGAGAGSLLSGALADKLGRKRLILLAAVVFSLGIVAASLAPNPAILILARLVLGLGIGIVAVSIPIYLAELAPAAIRGRVGTLTQLMIASGILLAYIVNYLFSPTGDWRWMIGVAIVPALALLVGVVFLPESPRWLVKHGREDEARTILAMRIPADSVDASVAEIHRTLAASKGSWRDLIQPWVRPAVIVAVLLAIFAQLLGINTIVFYAPTILSAIGFSDQVALLNTIGFGVVSIIFTVIAFRIVDVVGRKKLLTRGSLVMGGSMLVMAIISITFGLTAGLTGYLAVLCLVVFKATYSLTWGTVTRVVQSEILPLTVRGTALGLAEVFNFASTFVLSAVFPMLLAGGTGLPFFVFAIIGIAAFIFVRFFVRESKGLTLEQIEEDLRTRNRDSAR